MAEVVDTVELGLEMLRDALRDGRAIDIKAFGFSMWPRIKDGTLVRVEPCSGRRVRPGDVVLFERPGRFVLHRVLRVSGSRLLLKGDACFDVDGWIPREQVLGRLSPRPGDAALARLGPLLGRPLGLASVVARRVGGFASKF